ncbi:unnamed protein product, partial [Adineta steineri]
MQHELGTENMVMINNLDNPTTRPLALVKDLKVQQPRIVLLSLLGFCLFAWLSMVLVGLMGIGLVSMFVDVVRGVPVTGVALNGKSTMVTFSGFIFKFFIPCLGFFILM